MTMTATEVMQEQINQLLERVGQLETQLRDVGARADLAVNQSAMAIAMQAPGRPENGKRP